MAKITKIEQYALADFIFTLYQQGLSTRQVSERIKTEKDIYISYKAIAEFLEKTRSEAGQISRSMKEEHIRKKLPGHLDKLDCIIEDLYKEYKQADLKEKLAITRELRPTIELIIGRAPEDHGEMGGEDYLKEIECKLDSIVERRRKASLPQKPDPTGSEEAPV